MARFKMKYEMKTYEIEKFDVYNFTKKSKLEEMKPSKNVVFNRAQNLIEKKIICLRKK